MVSDVFTFLVGGKAGEGVKKAGSVAAHIFSSIGRHVFQMDDLVDDLVLQPISITIDNT